MRPEIVIGLTSAIGTDLTPVMAALKTSLLGVGYDNGEIHVSSEIAQYAEYTKLEFDEGASPDETAMNRGDALREATDVGAAAAVLTIAAIQRERLHACGENVINGRDAYATIIRQLKHPDEVRVLRQVYGTRFVLVACSAPEGLRLESMGQRLQDQVPNKEKGWYSGQAQQLIDRDQKDGSTSKGQQVKKTFELADAYLTLWPGRDIAPAVRRMVNVLFSDPFITPTRDEQGMFHAFGARLRSSAGGRQVGAAAVDDFGEILATGTNDVPRALGGQFWDGEEPNHRDFAGGFDFNDREKQRVVADFMARLAAADGWLTSERAVMTPTELAEEALSLGGPVQKSRVADILEFGRILHAEMAVICTAARRGTALSGTTLYTTTYPCHECARLIIGAGIARVVFVDPYPKSMVASMYADQTTEDPDDVGGVRFESYTGIAPRVFADVFAMSGRDRDPVSGKYVRWDPRTAMPKLVKPSDQDGLFLDREDAVVVKTQDWPSNT